MFLPHFDVFCHLFLKRRTATWNLFVLHKNEQKLPEISFFFISKCFNITRKQAFAQFGEDEKKPFDETYYLYKMKQFYWLLCLAKNCDFFRSRKITPLSKMTRVSLLVGMETYSEGRIKLRNPQSLKKMLEKSSQFLSSEQPCQPKSLDATLKTAGVEKISSEN